MKKNRSTCIKVTHPDGTEVMYGTIEEAMEALSLTKRQLEMRATKGGIYSWCDPSTWRSYLGRRSRRKGNAWELEIVNALREIGYPNCVSSRSESKRMDDGKVDIVDLDNTLPCYIQAKNTKNLPNYHKIEEERIAKDKPFVIACKQERKKPIVIMPLDYFYELIKRK